MGAKRTWRLVPGAERVAWNILFDGTWPMQAGRFPAGHPCADDPCPFVMPDEQPESDTAIGRFRRRGYWVSCFPEGDGITFDPLNGQNVDVVVRDIEECFGVAVRAS